LKKIKFLKFVPYSDFVSASKNDPKLEVLSEANNMYRTFSALFALLLLLKFYSLIQFKFTVIEAYNPYFLIILLLVIFLCAYKKQTKYIKGRIESILKNKKYE
jgi:magnesium-transporting ATPase (P-type)